MKRPIVIAGLVIALLGAFLFWQAGDSSTDAVRVGVVLPLSGELAFLGEEILRGVELAASESKLTLVVEDGGSLDPLKTVQAAKKILEVDQVSVGAVMLVEDAKPIAPLFETAQVPLFVLWDSNEFLENSGKFIFSTGFGTELAGQKMAEFMIWNGFRRVAIVQQIDPWAEIIAEAFREKFVALGGIVVFDERILPGTTDFRTTILKVKQKRPDSVFFPLVPMDNALFLQQLDESGLEVGRFTGDAFIQDAIDAAGESAEGVIFTSLLAQDSGELAARYKTQFGEDPLAIELVELGFDGAMTIAQAIEGANRKGDSIRESAAAILGPSRSKNKEEALFVVRDGKPTPLDG